MRTCMIVVGALMISSIRLLAQEDVVECSFPIDEKQKAVLNLKFAEKIEVKSWNKKELFIKAEILINDGLLNEAHTIDTVIANDAIEISTGFNDELIKQSRFADCNDRNKTQHSFNGRRGRGYSLCHTINYTVFLPANTDLEIETISGDVLIENLTSKIDVKSISGTVDVVIQKDQKADVLLESVTGRAFTEPPMLTTRDGLEALLTRKVSGRLNGGGKKVHLGSVSGNVRLRQQN